MKIDVELVPRSMWRRNVRAVVSNENWHRLRFEFGATSVSPERLSFGHKDSPSQKFRCAICETLEKRLHLHEEWRYDDAKRVQRLMGFKAVCEMCHLATHLGYANIVGRFDEALRHVARLNTWTLKQAREYASRAFETWQERSPHLYKLDLRYLRKFLPSTQIHLDWLEQPRTWLRGRFDAIFWARDLLESDQVVILDTETTGLIPENPVAEIIELAAINTRGKLLYESLFRPVHQIPRRVINIHGIRNGDVRWAPSFKEQLPHIRELLHGKIVVAYNARFERGILWNTFKAHELNPKLFPSCRWECAMMAKRAFEESPRLLPLNGSHRALADAKATLRLMRNMLRGVTFTTVKFSL